MHGSEVGWPAQRNISIMMPVAALHGQASSDAGPTAKHRGGFAARPLRRIPATAAGKRLAERIKKALLAELAVIEATTTTEKKHDWRKAKKQARVQAHGEAWDELCANMPSAGPLLAEVKREYDTHVIARVKAQAATLTHSSRLKKDASSWATAHNYQPLLARLHVSPPRHASVPSLRWSLR